MSVRLGGGGGDWRRRIVFTIDATQQPLPALIEDEENIGPVIICGRQSKKLGLFSVMGTHEAHGIKEESVHL